MIKRIILMIVIVFFQGRILSASDDDTWTGRDKILHAGVSFIGYTVLNNFCKHNTNMTRSQCKVASGSSMIAAGVVKELIDDEFSWKDMGEGTFLTGRPN